MGLENLEYDRAALQAVLDDFNSGQLKLQNGQREFIVNLKWRIRCLDKQLKRPGQAQDSGTV